MKKIVLFSLIFGIIIGSLSVSSARAFVFGSIGNTAQWIKDNTTIRLRTETDSVRVGSAGAFFVNTGSSRVGVGTTTPSYTLDVIGDLRVNTSSTLGNIISGIWNGTAIGDSYLTESYIKANGTRAFTGNQSFGDFNIVNVGDIALDSVSDDAGVENTLTIANLNTAYDHSQDNSQAHSDYLLNTGDTGTGDYILDGAVTINEAGADKDFRVEGVGTPNALFVDGTNGYVGINDYDNSAPLANLHLKSLQNTMQIFEQVGDGVIYGFGSAGGYFRIKYFGSLLGGSDSEFMRMGINVDINKGKKNIDFKYSGDTTANIFVLDAGLEEVKTLDNVPYTMGTGGDAKISYNNTDLILDPNVVGSGKVLIGATGDDTINAGAYEVGGVAGANFSGAITNLTVVNGIVTAAS